MTNKKSSLSRSEKQLLNKIINKVFKPVRFNDNIYIPITKEGSLTYEQLIGNKPYIFQQSAADIERFVAQLPKQFIPFIFPQPAPQIILPPPPIIVHGDFTFPSDEFDDWNPQKPIDIGKDDMVILIVSFKVNKEENDTDYSQRGGMHQVNIPELKTLSDSKLQKSPYTTATFNLKFNQIKRVLNAFFTDLFWLSYVKNITIRFPMHIELLYDPEPRMKRELYNQHFNYEGLIDYSVHPFLCVPDLIFHEFSKNIDGSIHTIGKGRYAQALTLNHILSSITHKPTKLEDIKPKELKCTVETIIELAEIYRPAYLRIYDIRHYNKYQEYNNAPLYEKSYDYNNYKNTIQGVTIFVIDDHIYSHPIKNTNPGHSPTDVCNRPGPPRPNFKNYSIVDNLDNLPATPVIFTTVNHIHEKVIQDLKSNNISQIIAHDRETSQITKIHTGRQTIIYAPDATVSTQLIADFNAKNKKDLEYYGQNHSSIAEKMLKSLNLLPTSYMSPRIYSAFTSELIQIYSPKGVVHKITQDAIYLDVVRHYYSTLKHILLPVYSISDDPEIYNGEPINNYSFYLVITSHNFKTSFGLCNGAGYYYGPIVQEMLARNYDITIKEKLTPLNHRQLTGIEEVIELFPKQKLVFNALWGRTKTSKTYSKNSFHYCTTWAEVMNLRTNESKISYIDFSDEIPTQKEFIRIADQENRKVLYMVSNSVESNKLSNDLPFHYCVVQMANLLLSRHILNTISNPAINVLAYSTDSVAVNSNSLLIPVKDKKECQNGEFGTYKGEFKFDCPLLVRKTDIPNYSPPCTFKRQLNPGVFDGTHNGIEVLKSFIIFGKPGTGKSYTLAQNIKAISDKKGILIMAPTNAAKESLMKEMHSQQITGLEVHTVSSALGYDNKGKKNPDGRSLITKRIHTIIVDEVFMVKQQMMIDIYKSAKTIILAGDPKQIEAIDEECSKFTLSIFGSFVKNLIGCNYMELTKNYRAEKDPNFPIYKQQMDLAEAGLPIDRSLFGTQETLVNLCYHVQKKIDLNIKISHDECRRLNAVNFPLQNVYYATFIGMPVITTFNNDKYKNGQKWFISQISNSQIVLIREFLGKFETAILTIPEYIKNCDPAYAQTVHSAQGSTIDQPMTIHEWDCKRCTKGWRNVALSRATKMKYVNFAADIVPEETDVYPDLYCHDIIDPDDYEI